MNSFAVRILVLISLIVSAKAATVTANFTSATTVPVTASDYTATGDDVNLSLDFAPSTGTNLTVINNTGLGFIIGKFSNLAQSQAVSLTYNDVTYQFIANYYGGTGNDLVLQWAHVKAYAWGDNGYGQLGNSTTTDSNMPVPVASTGKLSGKTVVALSGGGGHSLALCSDGILASWGRNESGQLGNLLTVGFSYPGDVIGWGVLSGKTVVAISAGGSYSLALCSEGTVAAWGGNGIGQLGDGTTTNSSEPVAVITSGALFGKTVVAISAGSSDSLALCSDGTVAAWGLYSNVPVAVSPVGALSGKTVVAISAGGHCLALCSDGTVAAWGGNVFGQLGDGTTGSGRVPVAVAVITSGALSGKTVVAISAGSDHSLALCSDGTVAAWGRNDHGQLGDGTTTNSSVPVAVITSGVIFDKTVVAISAGSGHSLALCSDGTVVAWGHNISGQLGNGTTTDSSVPVLTFPLAGGENFTCIGAGKSLESLALAALPLPAGDSSISTLTLSSGSLSPSFYYGTTSYTTSVPNAITDITVTPTATTSTATVKVNGVAVTSGTASTSIPLVVGSNAITVLVTSQDESSTTTYTVTVTRNSTVSTLSGLRLSSGLLSPTFAAETNTYTASVSNATTGITVTPTVTASTATVKVNGTSVTSGTASAYIPLVVGSNTITVLVTAQDGTTTSTYTLTVTRISNVSTLSGLALSSGTLSPSFYYGTTSYTASVSNATTGIAVTPTAKAKTATVTVNGTSVTSGTASTSIPLVVGSNTITVLVTAQDGTTTSTYTVTLTRAPSAVSTLSGLALSSGTLSPTFAAATKTYTASVANATTYLTVTPTVTDTTATVTVNGTSVTSGTASTSIPLVVGSNTITVLVTAQDGTTTTSYTVTVLRISNVSTLSGLALSSGTLSPTFTTGVTVYTASVSNATTGITVTPSVMAATATVTVNGTSVTSGTASTSIPLVVGSNTITVLVTAQDGTTTSTYTVTLTRISTVSTLAGLALSSGTLSPTFAAETKTYTASVANAVASMTVTPTVTDSTATVKVNGTSVTSGTASTSKPLVVGSNTITVLVTAQDGTTTSTYTVTVTRAVASTVSTLAALTLSSGTLSPTFAAAIKTYTASVSNATDGVMVTPTVTDSTATVKVNGVAVSSGSATTSIPLAVGTNTITVLVTAQNGTTTSTYTVTMTRISNVSTLSGLAFSSGILSPTFVAATKTYTVSVVNAIAGVTVTPTLTDSTATVKVNGTSVTSGTASTSISLVVGSNTITVLVTAQDGTTTSTYTVTVTRAPSAVSTLSGLALSSGTLSPSFYYGTTSYTASVSNATTGIAVTPTVMTYTATVKVNGTSIVSGTSSDSIPLVVGSNTITVLVTAQDGTTTSTYTVTVTRPPSAVSTLSSLALSSGTLSPAFAVATKVYTAIATSATADVTVTPAVTDTTATVKVNGVDVDSGTASVSIPLVVGSNTITVLVTAQNGTTQSTYTVTVTRKCALSISPLSNGTITGVATGGDYQTGTTATLTAIPDAGYAFTGWTGDATGATNPLSLLMDGDKTIGATFTRQYTLTTSALSNNSISGVAIGGKYLTGTSAVLTAVPVSGYSFTGWTGDASGTDSPLSLLMNGDKAVGATFTRQYTFGNVRAAQHIGTKLVDIYYDITGIDRTVAVTLEISSDGGITWTVPATTLSGAVGTSVTPGNNMHIIWDAGADWNNQLTDLTRFRIKVDDSTGLDVLALIPAGSFTMGDALNDGMSGSPQHAVTLSGYYMQMKGVSKAEWDDVRSWGVTHGYTDLGTGSGKAPDHPVQRVTWHDSVKWCNARSEKNGLTPCYYKDAAQTTVYRNGITDINSMMVKWEGTGYRLPTEAEREKAARGGLNGKRFPWGDIITHTQANYRSSNSYSYDNSLTRGYHPSYGTGSQPYTSPVGSFEANGYGLYDMAGNVWEWCWDWLGTIQSTSQNDPRGPESGSSRVFRGGCWSYYADYCRVAFRISNRPDLGFNDVGLRPVRSLVPANILTAESQNITVVTRDWILTHSSSINGTITGIATDGMYQPGSTATLTAAPANGYAFTGWAGSAIGTTNPLSLLMDGDKTITANFAPDTRDTDGDGLSNYLEAVIYGTNPDIKDTDGDGLEDGLEVGLRRFSIIAGSFTWAQARADAHARGGELACFPTAARWDRAMETLGTGAMDNYTGLWIGASDATTEGGWTWVNGESFTYSQWASSRPNTTPGNTLDYAEVSGGGGAEIGMWYDRTATFIRDGYIMETGYATDPLVADVDDDGLNDGAEVAAGTNPFMTDTDGDGLTDGQEVNIHQTNPKLDDSDGDGFLDGAEVEFGGNPNSITDVPAFKARTVLGTPAGILQFRFLTQPGQSYTLEASTDLVGWDPLETGIAGTGGTLSRTYTLSEATARWFRAKRE